MSARRTLARVVLPADPARLPLHVDAAPDDVTVLGRRRLRVEPGATASFGTLLSALPACHWQRSTALGGVVLQVEVRGPATVEVLRSDADGRAAVVDRRTGPGAHEVEVPLAGFKDGGSCWFDLRAGDGPVVLEAASWQAPGPVAAGGVTIGITTLDRPGEVLAVLRALAGDPEVLALLDEVLVVDQGAVRLRDQPGLPAAQAALGGRLRVLEQPNLGGSGGFARSMLEALRAGRSAHLLLLDDDVAVEPDSVLRAAAFADACTRPTLVGGQMLDLRRPTVLHTPGERVDPHRFLWETVPPGREDVDLAVERWRTTPELHRRLDVGFNAWWTCLLPLEVLRRTGLALPLFLKWDDVEHGLRAAAHGVPTVTLPGVAVWHEPWAGKPDALGWQAYYHHRNRLIAGLLHSPRPLGGALWPESLQHTVRALRTGRRDVAALRLLAMRDLLDGPDRLHADLTTSLPRVHRARVQPAGLARLALGTAVQHARLGLHWRRLRRRYRAAAPGLSDPATWARTLGLPAH